MQRSAFSFPRLTRFTKKLLIGLFTLYVAELLLVNWIKVDVFNLLALSPSSPMIWQFVTFAAVDHPGAPIGFLVGIVFLWWILPPFEKAFGPQRTMHLCAAAILGAAIPAALVGQAIGASPQLYGSGPIWFAALSASADMNRGRSMSLFGMLTMTANQFLLLLIGLSVFIFLADQNHTRLVGDLGAMAAGIGLMRWMRRPPRPRARAKRKSGGFRVIDGGRQDDEDRPKWLN